MTRAEEEEEVRSLLERHQERIIYDLANTDLLTVLVKNAVLSQSEEDLLLKPSGFVSASCSTGLVGNNGSNTISSLSMVRAEEERPFSSLTSGVVTDTNIEVSAVTSTLNSNGSSSNSSSISSYATNVNTNSSNQSMGSLREVPSIKNSAMCENRIIMNGNMDNNNGPEVDFNDDGLENTSTTITASSNTSEHSIRRLQCSTLIEIVSKNGFEKFKQFCYAIESECPQLIEDLINDRLKGSAGSDSNHIAESDEGKKLRMDLQKENVANDECVEKNFSPAGQNKRSASCSEAIHGDSTDFRNLERSTKSEDSNPNIKTVLQDVDMSTSITTLPRAAPRRVHLMKEPPPPPPPKPMAIRNKQKLPSERNHPRADSFKQERHYSPSTNTGDDYNTSINQIRTQMHSNDKDQESSVIVPSSFSPSSKFSPALYQKMDTTASNNLDRREFDFYVNTVNIATKPLQSVAYSNVKNGCNNSNDNGTYSSLLCHSKSTTASPLAIRKREKLLHRFSDAATLGRKLRRRKQNNRTCRSMTETIEMLADPVVEDEFLADRTTWEYHTISVTRVPGYGFGIAVSGGRDNPHFANGDPSIAVSDVLKGGPAEDRLQVNDRIISVNGVSLENVEYTTAVQVLRDSGNTVTLVVKRRVPVNSMTGNNNTTTPHYHSHQHQHSLSSVGLNVMSGSGGSSGVSIMPSPTTNCNTSGNAGNLLNTSLAHQNLAAAINPNVSSTVNHGRINSQSIKVTLTKNNKKDDYGIVLGCRLFIKEISTKARDQLAANGYSLQEGDILSRIHNTNCGDTMNLKEAKKIIDGCKERLNLVVMRDMNAPQLNQLNNISNHNQTVGSVYNTNDAAQTFNSNTLGHQTSNCNNNFDDPYLNGVTSYSSQNLYVQPPTRSTSNGLSEEKSNLTPRGRSRGPLMEGMALQQQLDRPSTPTTSVPNTMTGVGAAMGISSGNNTLRSGISNEDFYSTRRQIYEEDSAVNRSRQLSEPRFISFQKEGSVGIRLTGGNETGIFVTAVQPGSPASLQGLTPGDKILKVNDMDMHGVTREEAVLFLLSLQDRIDLIVQYCKKEYDEVIANQRGDSFHIKTHFHCDNPLKGEMPFKAGDVFRVVDTLHNGVVGSWKVLKIGRGHQEMQRGVIPNKSRAEELATAQFNATKKEMNANESRGNFFRRRRSTHRRSKSLSRENWDDVVFADSISKFPAYERVVLRHPGFVRPAVIFGPLADVAREKLTKDFPDKFASLQLQEDDKSNSKSRIVRLSNIRDVMDCGKHALLDITPNAVDRLNYAQFYPIVVFLKADNKYVIKQLRQGLPKHAHKSSKKLFEQCQKLDKIWSHIFNTQIILNDEDSWYLKLRDAIDLQQSGAVWMSESKPVESLSDDFLFPMTTSRLSYASSPESDLELSPGPSSSLSLGNLPQLVKSNSDPSIATNQDNMDRDRNIIGEGMPPPYTIPPYDHSSPSVSNNNIPNRRPLTGDCSTSSNMMVNDAMAFSPSSQPRQTQLGAGSRINAPDLPPRIDRQSKPSGSGIEIPNSSGSTRFNGSGDIIGHSGQEGSFDKLVDGDNTQVEYISRTPAPAVDASATAANLTSDVPPGCSGVGINIVNNGIEVADRRLTSLERQGRLNNSTHLKMGQTLPSSGSNNNMTNTVPLNGTYESTSIYDSYNHSQLAIQNLGRLGPNAPDDLKSVPNVNANRTMPPGVTYSSTQQQQRQPLQQLSGYGRSVHHDHRHAYSASGDHNDLNRQSSPERPQCNEMIAPRNIDGRGTTSIAGLYPQRSSNFGMECGSSTRKMETKTDYGKFSNRSNSATHADYGKMAKAITCSSNSTSYGTSGHVMTAPQNNNNNNTIISGGNTSNNNGSNGPFKPVPPPKPKNYRPPLQNSSNSNTTALKPPQTWEHTVNASETGSPRSPSGFYYPASVMHHHYTQQNSSSYSQANSGVIPPPTYGSNEGYYGGGPSLTSNISPTYNSVNGGNGTNNYNNGINNSSHHYNGGSGTGPYIAPHRGIPPPIAGTSMPSHTPERHGLDLAGSREQRGSAFELYRKPQIGITGSHHHNISRGFEEEPYDKVLPHMMSPTAFRDYYYQDAIYGDLCSVTTDKKTNDNNVAINTLSCQKNYPRDHHAGVCRSHSVTSTHSPPIQKVHFHRYDLPPDSYCDYMYNNVNRRRMVRIENEPPPLHSIYSPESHYSSFYQPPPIPPKKPVNYVDRNNGNSKKKISLKNSLSAIKNVFMKSTRPLRRMNSLVEPLRPQFEYHQDYKSKTGLRRQRSMLEREVQRPFYPDEYPSYPEPDSYRVHAKRTDMKLYINHGEKDDNAHNMGVSLVPCQSDINKTLTNSTYQNLEGDGIYNGQLNGIERKVYEDQDLYANRALIDLERRQAIAQGNTIMADGSRRKSIIRRHSTTTADREDRCNMNSRINVKFQRRGDRAEHVSMKSTAPSSEIMRRRCFYPGAANDMLLEEEPTGILKSSHQQVEPIYQTRRELQREMQRNHLYQTRKEMQEKILQGKKEIEKELSNNLERHERSSVYDALRQSNRHSSTILHQEEINRRCDKNLSSGAFPKKCSVSINHSEPIYEVKEDCTLLMQAPANATDEKKEEETNISGTDETKEDITVVGADVKLEPSCHVQFTPTLRDTNIELEVAEIGKEGGTITEDKIQPKLSDTIHLIGENSKVENVEAGLTLNTHDPVQSIEEQANTVPQNSYPLNNINSIPATINEEVLDDQADKGLQCNSLTSLTIGPPNASSTPFTSTPSLLPRIPETVTEEDPIQASSDAQEHILSFRNRAFPPYPREPKTTRGYFDCTGGTLTDTLWNVSLYIPPGALAEGVRQEIYFTVSDPRLGQAVGSPPLDMENGETMLSPLVMCGPQGLEFLVPVTLNIPHRAGETSSLGLALKATDSEKQIHTEWDNMDLPSNASAHTVSVKVDHF